MKHHDKIKDHTDYECSFVCVCDEDYIGTGGYYV